MVQPIIIYDKVEPRTPTTQELADAAQRAQQRLDAGDRAGAYIELYKVTGNEQLLMQAQITTYSGAIGGMALEGNFRAKLANPEKYTLTLDQFSHEIDQRVVKLAGDSAKANDPKRFNSDNIQKADRSVWEKYGMGQHFPGNAQFIIKNPQYAHSEGTKQAILAQDEMELGRRPAEYRNDPRYVVHEKKDSRFISVTEKATGRIVVFFDKEFDSTAETKLDGSFFGRDFLFFGNWFDADLEQIKNQKPSPRVETERNLKMDYLQAGKMATTSELPRFNPNLPRPPENLDRVFKFEGKYYQFDDSKLLELTGLNFNDMYSGKLIPGNKYAGLLKNAGYTADRVLEGDTPPATTGGSRKLSGSELFQMLKDKGIIKPLSQSEEKYYREKIENLPQDQQPFQKPSDAFKMIRDAIFSRSPSVSQVDGNNRSQIHPDDNQSPYITNNDTPQLHA